MICSIDKFFIPENEVKLTEELDYNNVDQFIKSAEAFSRSTYQSVYIIDYFRQNFLYVSPNPMFLCGLTPEEMKKMGYRFYFEFVPEDEHQLLLDINEAGFSFYNQLPVEGKRDWTIQYDFHVGLNNHPILVHHKLTSLALTSDGRIWLALCVVSLSTHTSPGHIEIHKTDSPEFFEYNLVTSRWDKRQIPTLTKREKLTLSLSIQGYSISEISDQMCLSPETIKKYRKQIFDKLRVKNISEAIMAATNNKIL